MNPAAVRLRVKVKARAGLKWELKAVVVIGRMPL